MVRRGRRRRYLSNFKHGASRDGDRCKLEIAKRLALAVNELAGLCRKNTELAAVEYKPRIRQAHRLRPAPPYPR